MTIATGLPWDLAFEIETSLPPGIELNARFDPATNVLTVSLESRASEATGIPDIRLGAPLTEPAIGGRAHLQGRYMQQDALTRVFGADREEGYSGDCLESAASDGSTYISREVVALHLPARPLPALVIGSLRTDRFFCDIRLHCREGDETLGRLSLTFPMEGTALAPGERLDLPPILVGDGHDTYRLLEAYGDRAAVEMGARVPATVPSGWCSWYYFYNRVSEADIVANLETMRATNHPADYVQVDDGYQSHTGDWLVPNEKFPAGMASLAARISEAGYRPGLWLAPFVMHRESVVLRDHPDFALATSAGEPLFIETWLGPCAVLDCTHPGAAAWLGETVRTVREWGYTFLKLDALAFAAQPGDRVRYQQPGTTALQNVRRGLEIIRAAAGDDTFILGCTCHFGPAVGLVDAMRVGPDVKATWADGPRPSVRHAMRMSLQRNWMHRRWWLNDPDCLVLRDTDTELNRGEVHFLAAAVALSGGLVVSSDNLPALSEERATLTRSLVPAAGVAATPLDPGEGPVPSAWRARIDDTRSLVGVLNWSEGSRWVSPNEYLEPGEVAFAPWSGQVLGKGDLLLQPHEGTLWQVSAPSPTPRLVGDTGHISYDGLYVRPVSGRLQLRNDSDRSRTVAVEARGRITLHELAPGDVRWFD